MGVDEPDGLEDTAASIMRTLMDGGSASPEYAIMEHEENVCFVPGNIELSGVEASLVNAMGREYILKEYNCLLREYC